MIEGIVFDMDGVLADTEFFYERRREQFLARMDYAAPCDCNFIGSNEKAIWQALVPQDPVLREEMLQGYRAYRKLHPARYEELADPQVGPLFRALRARGVRIAIASSSDPRAIRAMMQAAGITALVDYTISGEECTAHKPAPEIYLRAVAALGLAAENVFAVEDSPIGIAAAKNAGLRVYALRPRHGEALDQSAADGVLNSLSEVLHKL